MLKVDQFEGDDSIDDDTIDDDTIDEDKEDLVEKEDKNDQCDEDALDTRFFAIFQRSKFRQNNLL